MQDKLPLVFRWRRLFGLFVSFSGIENIIHRRIASLRKNCYMRNIFIFVLCLVGGSHTVLAQITKASRAYFDYLVTTTHPDRCYRTGEEAAVKIFGFAGGVPLDSVQVSFEAGDDMLPVDKKGTVLFRNGEAVVPFGTMKQPGFRYCHVRFAFNGENYKETLKVAFSPEDNRSVTEMPEDFRKFWEKAMKQAAKVPMEVEVTPMPELSTDKVEVSIVKLPCSREGRCVYGYLSKPRAEGKYPVLMVPPGAGVKRTGASSSYAEEGFITLAIEIHGISPVVSDEEMKAKQQELGDYWLEGIGDKDTYYYKDVYLGCVRAVDYLCSLPEFDGKNVGVCGGSQGGALSIVTAGLDKRVTFVAAFYPALCDVTGFLHGRAGGWPRLFMSGKENKLPVDTETACRTLAYYDVVNFARTLTIPGFYSFGYNDNTCPPTSVQAAVNAVTAPKVVVITPTSSHWRFPESNRKSIEWMKKQFR